jgi:hypothetical protein
MDAYTLAECKLIPQQRTGSEILRLSRNFSGS